MHFVINVTTLRVWKCAVNVVWTTAIIFDKERNTQIEDILFTHLKLVYCLRAYCTWYVLVHPGAVSIKCSLAALSDTYRTEYRHINIVQGNDI